MLYNHSKPRGRRLETRVEAKKPSAKNKSVCYTLRKPRGRRLETRVEAKKTFSKKWKCVSDTRMPRYRRSQKWVTAKKPSAKMKYTLPKSSEQDCKRGGRCFCTILQPSSQRLRHIKTMKPRDNLAKKGGGRFRKIPNLRRNKGLGGGRRF